MITQGSVLVLDDEPHLLDWLIEYLLSKGYATRVATNVPEAMTELRSGTTFRMMILDLNVPAPGEYSELLRKLGSTYESYRGLYVAREARNMGYRGRQVIVYSVHDVDAVRVMADKMEVTYITKGRPRTFKAELDNVLSFDPSTPKA